jgi:hypothetical protein
VRLTLVSDRYQLQRKLEDDGSATAWEAFDRALERRVLVKVLRADRVAASETVERFRRDVREAARATSPSGARVLDAGDDPATGAPFVVFEWTDRDLEPVAAEPETTSFGVTRPMPRVAPRAAVVPRSSGLGVERLALLLLVIPVALGAVLISNWLSQPSPVRPELFTLPSAPATTEGPSPVATGRPAIAPTARPQPTATPGRPQPTPTPPEVGERRRIANTDGIGVALRGSPGGDRLPGKGYDEGVTVTLLEQQGAWAHIRGDDGREGWVLAVTLVR